METSIADFHTSFYITSIKNLEFHLPHIRIIGTNNYGNTRREAFKRRSANQDVLSRRDYTERVVTSFSHKIKSEEYGGNRSVSIEGIALDHFIVPTHTETEGTPQAGTHHDVFH